MSRSLLFSRHAQSRDFLRAGFALVAALLTMSVLAPMITLAGTGGQLGLKSSLEQVLQYLQSDVAKFVMFLALIGVLGGIIVRSQRSESIGGLAAVAAAFVVLLNVQGVFQILGVTTTTPMASNAVSAQQALPAIQEALPAVLF